MRRLLAAAAWLCAASASAETAEELVARAERSGSPSEQLALATQALGLSTDPREKTGIHVVRAAAYSALCENARALAEADAAVTLSPQDESGYMYRAQVRSELKDCAGAFADLKKVDELLGKPDPAALLARYNVQKDCGSPLKERLASLEAASALSLKAGESGAYAIHRQRAARNLCEAKRYDEGLAEAAKAAKTGLYGPETQLIVARCLLDAGREKEGLARLDRAIASAEAGLKAHLSNEVKDTAEARTTILRDHGSLVHAYADRAQRREAAGRLDPAIDDLTKAIERSPEPPAACRDSRRGLGRLYARRAALWARKGERLFAGEDRAAACAHGEASACPARKTARKR